MQQATVSADSGSPGVLTLTETFWPVSGPRQTLVALTFTLSQAVVSKTIPVWGLVLSWIDQTQGMNFCKERTRSSAYRGRQATRSGRGSQFLIWRFAHPSKKCLFLNSKKGKLLDEKQTLTASNTWFICLSCYHCISLFKLLSEKSFNKSNWGYVLHRRYRAFCIAVGRVGSTHCCEEGWKRGSLSCYPLTR